MIVRTNHVHFRLLFSKCCQRRTVDNSKSWHILQGEWLKLPYARLMLLPRYWWRSVAETNLLNFIFYFKFTLSGVQFLRLTVDQRRIFIFGALGYFKLGALMEGMSYKLALHVLVTFIKQVVAIYKQITLFSNPSISGTKTVTMTLTKRQRWSYMTGFTTLPLHIYWVPQWPPVTWKMDSGVLFHTLTLQ